MRARRRRFGGGLWCVVLLSGFVFSGCSIFFTSGAPDTPLDAATAQAALADPPCTQSAAWPWVDVVFVGAYGGVATASASGALEIGLGEAIGLAVGTAAHAVGAIIGFGRVGGCGGYMHSAQMAAGEPAAVGLAGPAGTGAPPAGQGGPPVGQAPPAVPVGPVGSPMGATFTLTQVQSLQRGVQTADQLLQWFGPPLSRAALSPPSPRGCVQLWTWMRGPSALSVAFAPDGTVCDVGTAGPPPPP